MAKILMSSDSPTVSTGYGRVMSVLVPAFIDAGHEVVVVGQGYQEEPHGFPCQIVPAGQDVETTIANAIRGFQPDILFTLGDPWMHEFVPTMDERSAVAWIAYFPIDGYPVPSQWHNWMRNIDVPVTFSKFSFDLVKEVLGKDPLLIYHGVDTQKFQPLDKNACKQAIIGRTDKFVVGTVARNQPRKNLPALIKSFAEFAKNRDDVVLYMHTQVRDVGWNLDEIVKRFGIENKVLTTQNFNALKGVSDHDLNILYSMFDLFALPTMSEGFGLPIMEAQSAGTPVLVTDFSACSELVVNRQELIKVKSTLVMGRNIEQAIVDEDDMTRKMGYFYSDWKRGGKELQKLAVEGRKKAESFDWSYKVREFIDLLNHITPQVENRPKVIAPTFFKI